MAVDLIERLNFLMITWHLYGWGITNREWGALGCGNPTKWEPTESNSDKSRKRSFPMVQYPIQ